MAIRMWTALPLLLAVGYAPLPLLAQDEEYDPDSSPEVEVLHRQSATVNGTVRLDGGVAPPEPIPVEVLCDGRPVNHAFTDRKGHFTLSLGVEPSSTMIDASAPSNTPATSDMGAWLSDARPLGQCQIRILLSGYRPEVLELSDTGAFGLLDVGTVVLQRLAGVTGAAVSVTSYEAPREARKLFDAAVRETHRKKPDLTAAIKKLEAAVEAFSRYAAAWDLLGDCHWASGSAEPSRRAYESAVAADHDYLPPYEPLIRLAVQDQRWEDVDQLAAERLRLAPSFEAAYYRSLALLELGSIEAAERSLEATRASAGAQQAPQIFLIEAEVHVARGRFKQAAAQFERFLLQAPDSLARAEIEAKLASWRQDGKLADD